VSSQAATQLPWDALKHTEGDIPWHVLNQFADALAAHPPLWEELREVYDKFMEDPYEVASYECYYVPAIFALAAPRLDEATRRAIGQFLVDEMICAGDRDDEGMLEVLEAAAGSLGAPVLPAVLDWIGRRPRYHAASLPLWSLTELAEHCDAPALREQVVRCCQHNLERAELGKMDPILASCPAWTLARMGRGECGPLIQRVLRKTHDPDTKEALLFLEGNPDYEPGENAWEEPVTDWLPVNCKGLRAWYEGRDEDEGDSGPDYEEAEDWGEEAGSTPLSEHRVQPEPIHAPRAVGRNDPCPCGSGKKFKKCCAKKGAAE